MSDILGNWPVTDHVALINNAIVAGDTFNVVDGANPGEATVSFVDSANNTSVSIDTAVGGDGKSLSGSATVGSYVYYVTAMVETVGSPSVLYKTISGTVLRKGGGTEDSGGQWNGGPLRP